MGIQYEDTATYVIIEEVASKLRLREDRVVTEDVSYAGYEQSSTTRGRV